MSQLDEPAEDNSLIAHEVDFETCYVTQRGRGVAVAKKGELDAQEVFAPPQAWGNSWVWNVLEDRNGICLRRT